MSGKQVIRSVHAGPESTFLVTVSGRVLACGSNEHNKLGFNNTVRGVTKQQVNACVCVLVHYSIVVY